MLLTGSTISRFHPVFLGGINVMSGNKPPWTLPAKAVYGAFDSNRAMKYFGIQDMQTPKFFPILSILVSKKTLHQGWIFGFLLPL